MRVSASKDSTVSLLSRLLWSDQLMAASYAGSTVNPGQGESGAGADALTDPAPLSRQRGAGRGANGGTSGQAGRDAAQPHAVARSAGGDIAVDAVVAGVLGSVVVAAAAIPAWRAAAVDPVVALRQE
jgi:hypothetical protein